MRNIAKILFFFCLAALCMAVWGLALFQKPVFAYFAIVFFIVSCLAGWLVAIFKQPYE